MQPFSLLPILVVIAFIAGVARADARAATVEGASTVQAVAAARERALEFDGVVEAVRAAGVAAQVPGTIVGLEVVEGDRVDAGRILLRIDARIADRQAAAHEARLASARADLAAVSREVERQRRLRRENFISAAALERAEASLAAARARVDALTAEVRAARLQTGLHALRAPFAGVVSDVPVSEGDMAVPGVPLLDVYDPAALRVAVSVPQAVAARLEDATALWLEVPVANIGPIEVSAAAVQSRPVVDATTHTARLRIKLPDGGPGIRPGMFARLHIVLPDDRAAPALAAPVLVPASAIVRRAELTGLYILDDSGRPVLRQVRLGRAAGDLVEVLAGVSAGEPVFIAPFTAARLRRPRP